jgi:hypothetical protein
LLAIFLFQRGASLHKAEKGVIVQLGQILLLLTGCTPSGIPLPRANE